MSYRVQRWGVEIEAYGLERRSVKDIVEDVTDDACVLRDDNGYTSPLFWAVVHDGSIGRSGEFELRTPALIGEEESWDKLRTVCDALRQAGAKVGATCGLHVHQDASLILKALQTTYSSRDAEHVLQLVGWGLYARMEPVLDTLMPPSRRGNNNKNCLSARRPGYNLVRREVGDILRGEPELLQFNTGNWIDHHTKLSVTSLSRHSTLEYRHHSGTLSAAKIVPWIKLTGLMQSKIAEIALRNEPLPDERDISTLEPLLRYLGASDALSEYLVRRQAALAQVHRCDRFWECDDLSCLQKYSAIEAEVQARVAESTSSGYAWTPIKNIREVVPLWSEEANQRALMAFRASFIGGGISERRKLYAECLSAALGVRVKLDATMSRRLSTPVQDVDAEALLPEIDADYRDGQEPPYLKLTKAGVARRGVAEGLVIPTSVGRFSDYDGAPLRPSSAEEAPSIVFHFSEQAPGW